MSEHKDLRRYPSLRKHVDELLAEGAVITDRDPTTLIADGQALKARCGMLVGDGTCVAERPSVAAGVRAGSYS